MRISTLAHTYIGVALYGHRREAMPVYVWGVRLIRVMQIMQVMQHLFPHTHVYIICVESNFHTAIQRFSSGSFHALFVIV